MTDNQFIFACSLMLASLALTGIFHLLYWLLTVRKIDRVLEEHGNSPASFDIRWGRVGLYMWAGFWPAHFAKAGRRERLFDPRYLQGKVTAFDKALMVLQLLFFTLFLVVLGILW
ncbi:hypothetical protein PVT67_02890 [Gallaecimonas kandeliae]|uniref:hypothetical protein n=1 Tax=Gallaecimonas kandeliae TaxID=3029055 RepID=UPI002649C806|nr:hypothetical protein [Gallaecimonas kandeliae]WKE66209.1 hypothetical protein PVT67_02890 [Gallaecimonas kandeliae]